MKWFKRTSSIRSMVSKAVFLNIKNILVFLPLLLHTIVDTQAPTHIEPLGTSILINLFHDDFPSSTNLQPSLSTQFATTTMQFTIMINGLALLTTSSMVYSPRLSSRISTYRFARSSRQLCLPMSPCNTALLRATLWRPWSTRLRLMTVLLSWRALSRYAVLLILCIPCWFQNEKMTQVKERYPEVTLQSVVRDNSAQSASRAAVSSPLIFINSLD